MNVIITTLSLSLELFISINLFDSVFESKIKVWQKNLIATGLYIIYLLLFIFCYNEISNTVLYGLVNGLFASLCYHCSLKHSVLSGIFITVLMMGTELLTMALLSLPFEGDFNAFSSNTTAHILTVIFSKLFLLIAVKVSVHLGLFFKKYNNTNTPAFLFIFPICSMVILYTFWMIASQYELLKPTQVIIIASGLAVILSVILTYVFYSKTTKELDELNKMQLEADRVKADIAYYKLLDKQNNLLKTFIHDEKNHLSAIKSIANNSEVSEYIDKVYGEIKHHSSLGNTNNKMLDLMINKYHYICESNNIDFYVSIKTANLSYIEDFDLVSMLGNLLDNAVEAAKISTRKTIDFSINKSNGFDILTLTNSSDIKPIANGKKLKTTKTDNALHGLGLKSVKKIVAKYSGDFDWTYDENEKEFTVYVAFNV